MRKRNPCTNDNHRPKIIVLFDIILMLGLLSYAVVFYVINKTLTPSDVSGGYIIAEQHLFWRAVAEKICALCGVIYILGHIFAIYHSMKQKIKFSLKELALYFFIQIGIMLVCVIPFGLLDRTYFFDYIFPLYSIIGTALLLFVVSIFTIRSRT
jgi:hypothetical protein